MQAGRPDATARAADMQPQVDLFVGGPPMLVQSRLGLIRPGQLRVGRRCALFIIVSWLPLCVLTGAEGTLWPRQQGIALLADLGVLARSWFAGPLLLAADALAGLALSRIALRLYAMCARSATQGARLHGIIASTLRLRDLPVAEAMALLLACGLAAMVDGMSMTDLPLWHRSRSNPSTLSPAGWWYAMVSLPLLLALILGWVWRLLLWTRFLVLTSRLELPLLPVHPDQCAGVGFVGYSLRGFCCVGAAIGAVVAGTVANRVLHGGASLASFRYLILGTTLTSVIVFTLPLLAFSGRLVQVWKDGVQQYGQLATLFGLQFEREWFGSGRDDTRDMLDRSDFSAATDLYQMVDRVQGIRMLPVDLISVLLLAGATLAPFVPVVLLALPFDEVMSMLLGLLH